MTQTRRLQKSFHLRDFLSYLAVLSLGSGSAVHSLRAETDPTLPSSIQKACPDSSFNQPIEIISNAREISNRFLKGVEHLYAKAKVKHDSDAILAEMRQIAEEIELNSHEPIASLTPTEVFAVRLYTREQFCPSIQGSLRSENPADLAKIQPIIDSIDSALEKLPKAKPKAILRRTVPSHFSNNYKVGEITYNKGFTSTSLGKRSSFGSTTILIVPSKKSKGAILSSVADPDYSHEEEVLFKRKTPFKVIKKTVNSQQADSQNAFEEDALVFIFQEIDENSVQNVVNSD